MEYGKIPIMMCGGLMLKDKFPRFASLIVILLMLLLFSETAYGKIAGKGLVAEYHFDKNTYDSSKNGNSGIVKCII